MIFWLQKVKVNVVLADRESNKLIFSGKPKEKDESIARKKNLMVRFFSLFIFPWHYNILKLLTSYFLLVQAKLSVGDIVKCCIKKITYYGIFVEVLRFNST